MALKSRAGFTLVELMIAMIAGGFLVAALYYVYGMSAKSLAQQQQVSDAQTSLRAGMEQLRRDVARAGFLATPDTRMLRKCDGTLNAADDQTIYKNGAVTPANRFVSMNIVKNGSTLNGATKADVISLLDITNNKVRADELTMFGNYLTADQYITEKSSNTGTQIYPQVTSESFRRSFFTPAASNGTATFNQALFESTFASGRMVRLETAGKFFFRNVSGSDGSNAASPYVTLSEALPDPPCADFTNWLSISPVSGVHYAIEADSATDLARVKSPSAGVIPGQRRTMLVRREVDNTGALVANTGRLVLDFAVEFNIDAIVNAAVNVLTDRPTYNYALGDDVTTSTTTVAPPNRLRSLLLTLAVRTPESDPRLGVMSRRIFNVANTLNSPLLSFHVVDPGFTAVTNMYTRVRTMRSEILLENF